MNGTEGRLLGGDLLFARTHRQKAQREMRDGSRQYPCGELNFCFSSCKVIRQMDVLSGEMRRRHQSQKEEEEEEKKHTEEEKKATEANSFLNVFSSKPRSKITRL